MRAVPRGVGPAVAVALLAAFALPAALPVPVASVAETGALWQKFDPAAIERLVRDGKAVFVDVTADWCLNCKLNERLVLGSDAVARRLAQPEIVAMRADWTRPDGGDRHLPARFRPLWQSRSTPSSARGRPTARACRRS